MSVVAFSAQSLRRSVSRARSRAMASWTRPRRFDPRRAQASLRCSSRCAPFGPGQAGYLQQFPGRQRRGDGHPAVDADGLAVTGCRDRFRDGGEGEVPAPCAVHRHPVGLHPLGHRAGPAEPHPPGLGHPDLAGLTGYAADVPLLAAPPRSGTLRPVRPCATTAARPDSPGRRRRPPPERSPAAPAAVPSGSPRPATDTLRGRGELSALLQVAGRTLTARPPVRVLLDRQVPHVPGVAAVAPQHGLLAGRGQPVPGHANTISNTTDISGEVKRRFLPGLKARASTPRS